MYLHAGEFRAAASLVEETTAITEATRNDLPPYSALALAGWQGRTADAAGLIHAAINDLTVRGEGMGLGLVRHTSAVLSNGLGHYQRCSDRRRRGQRLPAGTRLRKLGAG